MRCWRVDLKRNFSRYLNGELAAREVERIENHLFDCGDCRTSLARLQSGHRFAGQLPRATPQRDPWNAIEEALDAEQPRSRTAASQVSAVRRGILIRPSFVIAAVMIVVGLVVAFIVVNRLSTNKGGENLIAGAFELRDFHRVAIGDIERNTEPHVVAEGYVSEVKIDDEDGDLTFKLVDDIHKSRPFIVCEIINPKRLTLPTIGSRVRVYGVSRYDNQENHNWYEVHPVLNIEVVRH
jgi:hypothetical protein